MTTPAGKLVAYIIAHYEIPDDLARLIYFLTLRHGYTLADWKDFLDTLHTAREGGIRALVSDLPVSVPDRSLPYFMKFYVPVMFSHTRRFEHTHIIGSSGSGKTQLIQNLILEDLKTPAALVVIAPKGNLIANIAQLAAIPPEKIVYVHPEHPIPLNVFNLSVSLNTEAETNNVVGLINYIFGSILDAGTTSKQTALLNYAIRLLLKHPGSTLLSMRSLMKSETLPAEYLPTVGRLSPIAQEFFHTQFGNKKTYGETKDQILWRLDLLLENPIIQSMFGHSDTHLNIGREMNAGKIILIDTSIKHLGEFGSSFLGRFFIALISLAAQQREPGARPVYVYIDEAATYLSGNIETMLERARESRVGLTIAHQQLAQLRAVSPQLEASVITNTATKYVGAVSEADARALASDMLVVKEQLQHQPPLHFTRRVKGERPLRITITPGVMEGMDKRERVKIEQKVEEPPPPQITPDDDIETLI